MERNYETPTMDVIRCIEYDIITTSGNPNETPFVPFNPNETPIVPFGADGWL